MRRRAKKQHQTTLRRRILGAEMLEERRLLAAISLLPINGSVNTQDETSIVFASSGSTIRFEASLTEAESPLVAYSLNFQNSSSDLRIANFEPGFEFPQVIDPNLDSDLGDYSVASATSMQLAIVPTLPIALFDVTMPDAPGDYPLSVSYVDGSASSTQLRDADLNRLPITDFGNVVLRVADPSKPIIEFSNVTQEVSEGDETFTVTVSLNEPSITETIVPFTLSGTATRNADFTAPASPLVIPAGQMSANLVFTVIDDLAAEEDETVVIRLGDPSGASLGSASVHTTTIIDNDEAIPSLTLVATETSVRENVGSVSLIATLSSPIDTDVIVPFTVAGTASDETDYTISPAESVTIPAGQTTAEIVIMIIDDFVEEPTETVIVRLDTPTGAVLGDSIRQVVTIIDDDAVPPPTVNFRSANLTVAENVGSVVVNVTLSRAGDALITVPFTVSGTATNGSDYTISGSPITFAPGQTAARIMVDVIDDNVIEPDESIVLALQSPTGALLGDTATQIITISNDDFPPPPQISIRPASDQVDESAGYVEMIVELSEPRDEIITVPFTISGTATNELDYASLTNQVRFAFGETKRTFKIHIVDDQIKDADKTLVVNLGAPSGAVLSSQNTATVLITDNDVDIVLPEVIFAQSGQSVGKEEGQIAVTATLSESSSDVVTVPFSVGGTAASGTDYVVEPSRFTFQPGETSAQVIILINGAEPFDPAETVILSLHESADATIGAESVFTATILASLPSTDAEGVAFNSNSAPLAGFVPNWLHRADVNADGELTPLDALLVINRLTQSGMSESEQISESSYFYDVNGDGRVSALDAVVVINQLSIVASTASGEIPLGILSSPSSSAAVDEILASNALLSNDSSTEAVVRSFVASNNQSTVVPPQQNLLVASTIDEAMEALDTTLELLS